MTHSARDALVLTPDDLERVGLTLYGRNWKSAMAADIFAAPPYMSKLAREGVKGIQAAAVLGLVARRILLEDADEADRVAAADARRRDLFALRDMIADKMA